MPDVVGKGLVAAFQAFDSSTQVEVKDLSGADRHVLSPAKWKVCTQNPAPGTDLAKNAAVTLGVVKKTEDCPTDH
jgi:ABC-type phosphonate transport system ATPase subunit